MAQGHVLFRAKVVLEQSVILAVSSAVSICSVSREEHRQRVSTNYGARSPSSYPVSWLVLRDSRFLGRGRAICFTSIEKRIERRAY